MDLSQMSQLETGSIAMSTPTTLNFLATGSDGSPISPVMPGPHLENSVISRNSKSTMQSQSFMRELDRVNEQQSAVSAKLEKEKKRELKLKMDLQETQTEIVHLKNSTGNGHNVRAREIATRKQIHKLEHQVMITRNKLSSARTNNGELKLKIDDKRKDKQLMLHIFHELEEELAKTLKKTDDASTKINELHEKKHRIGLDLQNVKETMVKSMEGFSRELDTVKETIEYNQNSLLEGIKDKLLYSSQHHASTPRRSTLKEKMEETRTDELKPETNPLEDEIETLLRETGVHTQEELMAILQSNEDQTFVTYRDVQDQTEEVERLETEVKHLENDLMQQNIKVEELEQGNNSIHENLDAHIQTIHEQIAKHDAACSASANVIYALSGHLVNLLRNLSSEEDSQHQSLLTSGANERNIAEFLGIVEARIAYVIQMTKAAGKVHLNSSDFKTREVPQRRHIKDMIPNLPQMQEVQLEDEEIDVNEDSKLRPVNVDALKDYMIKKVNKLAASSEPPVLEKKGRAKRRQDKDNHHRFNKSNYSADPGDTQGSLDAASIALPPKEPKTKSYGGSGRKHSIIKKS